MIVPTIASQTLLDLLRHRALEQGDRHAYSFYAEEGEERLVTYAELDLRARALGALLQSQTQPGDRALLLFPPGFEYLIAFWGCLYAGLLAVPAYPPRSNGNLERLLAVVRDCEATVALTTEGIRANVEHRLSDVPDMSGLVWLATEAVDTELANGWQEPALTADSLCFLQYTSGSTGSPKGVMLTHGNLLHNLGLIERAFETSPESRGVVWLPPYHDMGLIGGILQPLYTGYPMMLMAPVDFITKPLRWLQAISKSQASVSGGPNFAFELCVEKITPEQREGLDLSHWTTAFTGAEPIRAETLDRFAEYFAPCGFRREAFYPCYGLAEGTLFVAGGLKQEPPTVEVFAGRDLEAGLAVAVTGRDGADGRTLVSSGRVDRHSQEIAIVDSATGRRVADEQVGEIWVKSPSVAHGYWKREEQTAETFHAMLRDSDEVTGPFLRTGDLGFVREGELYVTGRLKDLIIIRGRNHYPQDIEYTVATSHEAVRPDSGAAFSVDVDGEERLVIVQEVERRFRKGNLEGVAEAIRQAVARHHELQVHAVVLIKPASIPKTSSGKIQRRTCQERYLHGGLEELIRVEVGSDAAQTSALVEASGQERLDRAGLLALPAKTRMAALVQELTQVTARVLKVSPTSVEAERPLQALGLDSLMAVELKHETEERFGTAPELSELLEGTSVSAIAQAVLTAVEASGGVAQPAHTHARISDSHLPNAPLSDGQRSLWFMHRLAPDSSAYHISRAVRLATDVNIEALQKCFAVLSDRHGSLRTTFPLVDGEPVQQVHPPSDMPFTCTVVDATSWTEQEVKTRLNDESQFPFDLEKGPLWRVSLFKRAEGPVLLLTLHHIIADFWSLGVLVKELLALYPALAQGKTIELPAPALTYAEVATKQSELLTGPRGEQLWSYWQKKLTGDLPVLNLPTDRPRPPVQTYKGASLSRTLGAELTEGIKRLAQQQNVTLYTTLLAAFQVFLARYTGQEDLLVGSPAAGRSSVSEADVFGYFVNPLVLRAQAEPDLPFTAFLAQVRKTVLEALDHQAFPFARLVERLQVKRDPSLPPLIQAMFVLQRSHALDAQGLTAFALGAEGARLQGELSFESVRLEQQAAQFDLTLQIAEAHGGLVTSFEYNTDLFDQTTVERMASHFGQLLTGIVKDPDQHLLALPMIHEEERERLLHQWNNTLTDYPRESSIAALFEQQAAETPDATALVCGEEQVTYAELNRRANQVAHRLQTLGVQVADPVAISMERSPELIIGVLAILKAGGCYVPVDAEYPAERMRFMLEDAGANVLLTNQAGRERLASLSDQFTTLSLDAGESLWTEESVDNLPPLATTAETPAYILYTSGSTGRPKGVCVPQRGVTRLVKNNPFVEFSRDNVFLQMSAFSFDAATFEIWGALLNGGRLAIYPPERLTAEGLAGELVRHQVTTVFFTAALFNQMVDHHIDSLRSLRHLMAGGEAMSAKHAKKALQELPHTRVINGYGPTESTTFAATYSVPTHDGVGATVPIGRPIANTTLYVLDAKGEPVPVGVPGELYIGGDGVALGYWKQDGLTAERFVPDRFAGRDGALLYRTGDLVRRMADGNVEYLGRLDFQVKIRGFRIEPGEIEAALLADPDVQEVIVLAREDAMGEKMLVAYFVPAPESEVTGAVLRERLKGRLPAYLVPARFVKLDAMPLTPNGKVDRKALPAPDGARDVAAAFVAATNDLERQIAEVWQEALQVDRVGMEDNFFDIGGHSLLMAKVHGRVQEIVGRDFSVVEMFRNPTVGALARYLNQETAEKRSIAEVRGQAAKSRDAILRQKQMQQLRKDRRK